MEAVGESWEVQAAVWGPCLQPSPPRIVTSPPRKLQWFQGYIRRDHHGFWGNEQSVKQPWTSDLFFTDVTVTNRNQSIQIPIWLTFTEPLVCGQDRANTRFDPAWLQLPFS